MKTIRFSLDLKISLIYILLGGAWILLTDTLLAALVTDASTLTRLQTYKGWTFVIFSALVIFLLLRRELRLRNITEGKLGESEERYRRLFENSMNAILLTSPDGGIHAANSAACAMFGRTEEELKQVGRNGVVDMSDPRLQSALEERSRTGKFHREITLLRSDGTKFEAEVSSCLFKDRNGLDRTSMIIRDVTERRIMELMILASLNRLQSVLNSISEAFLTLDRDWRITFINLEAARINKKRPEEFLGRTHWEEWPASVGTIVEQQYRKAMSERVAVHFEYRYYVEGEYDVWLDIRAYPIEEGLAIYYHDITERKRAEADLRASEERFRLLFENNHNVMLMIEPVSGEIRNANRAAERFYGYPLSELCRLKIVDINQVSPEEIREERMQSASEERNYHIFPHRLSSGEIRLVEVYSTPMEMDGETILFSIVHDITERRRAQDELKRSEERFSIVFKHNPAWLALTQLESGKTIEVNKAWERLTGHTRADAVGRTPWELGIYDRPTWDRIVQQIREKKSIINQEITARTKNGEERRLLTSREIIDIHGDLHLLSMGVDITARQQAEVKLKRNEKVLRLFVEHSPAAIAMFDREMKYIVASRRYLMDYGLGEQNVIGRSHYEVFPEMPDRWKEIHKRCLAGAVECAEEGSFPRASGKMDWVRWEIHPWYEANDEIGGIILFSEVVTERKRAEQALKESEALFKDVFESANVGKSITLPGGQLSVNRAFSDWIGYSQEELVNKTWQELTPAEEIEATQAILSPLLKGKKDSARFIKRYVHKNGSILWADVSTVMRHSGDGKPLHFITTIVDITERKQAEERLRESEERYRQLLDVSPVGVAVHSNGRLVFSNRAGARIIGADRPEDVIGKPITEIIHPDNLATARDRIRRLLAGEKGLYPVEDRYLRLDGSEVSVDVMAVPLNYEGKSAVQVIVQDITERKLAERELHLSRQRLLDLTRRLVETQEAERRAIGRELHDQFGQMLTALKINLDLIHQLPPEATDKKIAQAQEIASDLLQRVSRLSIELRPPMLDDLGLIPALNWHVNRYQEQTGIHVDFRHSGIESRRFNSEIESTAYRVIQEAFTNVARHALAGQISLDVKKRGAWLEIHIKDEGTGFDVKSALAKNRGLAGMRERIQLVGGKFEIRSEPNNGTWMLIRLPFQEEIQ